MAPMSSKIPMSRPSLDHIIQKNESQVLESKTQQFCKQYTSLPATEKLEILKELAQKHDFDLESAKNAAESFVSHKDKNIAVQLKAAERLKASLNPSYAQIFSRIRKLEGGVKFLVDLRADLMNMLPNSNINDDSTPHLKALNNYLKDILSFSFNVGFLKLERITWDSSCFMLEKISEYEAVHPVRNWTDIKHRVGPYRRCYVFIHSSMPREPIVVLHTALTNEISSNIMSIVRQTKVQTETDQKFTLPETLEDPRKIQAAIFYSITSTQKGLHGIELGNQLIKKVVREVQAEFPHIKQFSTLSPIPSFREWLLLELRKIKNDNSVILSYFTEREKKEMEQIFNCDMHDVWFSLHQAIISNRWISDEDLKELLRIPLLKICAHYLLKEKRRANVLNSVAHFHLRNGAVLWRLNWAGDTSPRGLDNSCGIMVNYRYYIDETEENSRNYVENYHVAASDEVKDLLAPVFSKSSL
ncbi:malonyl-CoA decarboxylase, mitochondrial-like isoform X2 [Uloborus diversus]|nr:malonyl-CoA decarboxylase, mitochondrial-like isoform X2 [Uloborus diversus]